MSIGIVLNQVITLIIILALGFTAKKKGIINESVNKKLSEILLLITAPLLIFSSFMMEFKPEKLTNAFYVMGMAAVMFVLSIFTAEKLLFRKQTEAKKAVLKSALVFSNCAFMGFPIIYAILGQEGVFYASMYVVVFHLTLWTYGVIIYSGERNFETVKKALLSPSMIAVYTGFIIFIFQIKIPYSIGNAAKIVGDMTTPLAMLIVGAIIADSDFKKALSGLQVYYISLIRLIVMPLVAYALASIISIPKESSDIVVIALAMPAAVNVAVFAEKFEKEAIFASKVVTVSTILSAITIPLIILLL